MENIKDDIDFENDFIVVSCLRGLFLTKNVIKKGDPRSHDDLHKQTSEIFSNCGNIDLIKNKLTMRLVELRDMDIFQQEFDRGYLNKLPQPGLDILLEWTPKNGDLFTQGLIDLETVLLSFRLLKNEIIWLDGLFSYDFYLEFCEYEEKTSFLHGNEDVFSYQLQIDEIDLLKKVMAKLCKLSSQEKLNVYSVALERFNLSLSRNIPYDSLIDVCIAFESLFMRDSEKQSEFGMGFVIGLACSMLIGKDEKERTQIRANIENGFRLRNKVVHAKKYDDKEFSILIIMNDYLRRSLWKFLFPHLSNPNF